MTSTFVFYLILFEVLLVKSTTDYSWRDYDGDIPEDAVVGGYDNIDTPIYIGRRYTKRQGFIVTEIYPGQMNIFNNTVGENDFEILCNPRDHFYWLPANRTQMKHLYLEKKPLVIVGNDYRGEKDVVGRIKCDFGFCIGKIRGNGTFRFYGEDRDGRELTADSFEVLVNEKKEPNGSESSLILTFPHSVGFVLCVLFSFIFS